MLHPPPREDDVLVGSLMADIFVLPHHTPTIGGDETVSLAPDPFLDCDEDAIRVDSTKYPIELVGYLEHNDPCVLRDLLRQDLIRIQGYVPEIAPAKLHGVNVSCRIHIYSNKNDVENVKSAITGGGLQFFSLSVDQNQKGVDSSTANSSVDEKEKGVDSSTAKSSVDEKQKGVDRSTATKEQVLGPDCGIFHNKTTLDVWDYIQKNKLQRDKKYVMCDENLKKVFNGKFCVEIPNLVSLIRFLAYNDKLVDAES